MKYFGVWSSSVPAISIPVRCAARGIGDPAVGPLERRDPRHLLVGQRKVEDVEILGHARGVRRAWDWNDVALLDQPAQRDLSEGAFFAGGNVGEHRVAQQTPAAEWAISGEDQTALATRRGELGLVEMGVILGLQIDQRLRTEPDRFVEHGDVEIRNPDMARKSLPFGLGERGNGFAEWNLRVRPMHEQEIDEVDAESVQALLDRARKVVGAQVFVRYLGSQKNLIARHAGGADAFADAAIGPVFPGRVDVTIAERERACDDLAAIAQGGGAKADSRHVGAVRGKGGDRGGSH